MFLAEVTFKKKTLTDLKKCDFSKEQCSSLMDDLRIETCWSDFKCFNVKKFCLCALVGVLIK